MKRVGFKFDFIKNRKIFFGISIGLVAVALLATLILGVNLDIQFKGGTIITYSHTGDLGAGEFKSAVEKQLGQSVTMQEQTNTVTGSMNYVVSLMSENGLSVDDEGALLQALRAQFPDNDISTAAINNVNPTIGKEFFAKCLVAVALAAVLMVIYIALRFRRIGGWSAGVMCVVALLHDVMIIYATFVLFRFPINDNFIAVVLTILGYSINDTIVIYDRIRENKKKYGAKMEVGELVNLSINQSFTRSIHTSVSTAACMVIICVVAMFSNVQSILTFAFPLLVGILSGFYSSLCLSGPLWVSWQRYHAAKKKLAK